MKASSFLGGGAFLKGEDVKDAPRKLEITGVETASFDKNGKKEVRLQILVDDGGDEKKITLNVTNTNALIAGFGDDTDNWLGKKIAAYFDPNVSYGGKRIGGLRLKVPGVKVVVPDDDEIFGDDETGE